MVHVLVAAGVDDRFHDTGCDGQPYTRVSCTHSLAALFPELGLDTANW